MSQYQFQQLEQFFSADLANADPAIQMAIGQEHTRQNEQIELIASENIVSKAVMQAQGTVLTNKYAEGYPGRRYYGGCEHVFFYSAYSLTVKVNCEIRFNFLVESYRVNFVRRSFKIVH